MRTHNLAAVEEALENVFVRGLFCMPIPSSGILYNAENSQHHMGMKILQQLNAILKEKLALLSQE